MQSPCDSGDEAIGSIQSPEKVVDTSGLHLGTYVADGETGDDWWYSLSPYYEDFAKARWSEWRLRRHALTNDRPVSEHFMEQLRALIRSGLLHKTVATCCDCPVLGACSLGRDSQQDAGPWSIASMPVFLVSVIPYYETLDLHRC